MIFMLFFLTILSDHLIAIDFSKDYVGYVFALNCGVYAIFSPLIGYLCKYIKKLFLTQVSFLIAFLALILLGPSEIFGFPESYTMIIIGMGVLGLSMSFIFVPLLPEIIDAI